MLRLLFMCFLLVAAPTLAKGDKRNTDFPGTVRLVLPKVIHATPGIELNIYFDNVVLVVNPANYIFDVTCNQGFQYDDRWTYVPEKSDAGDHPIMIEVRDGTNAVIARARSIVRVARSQPRKSPITLLAIGDSHLQRDVYIQHVLELSKTDDDLEITLIGCRGKENKPPSDDVRHEGYNGWTAEAFVTRARPKPRTGYYVPAETGSPFLYVGSDGKAKLDFEHYFRDFNNGQPIDFIVIQLGGNDIWYATDENIDQVIDKVFGYYDQLISSIQISNKSTKIGIAMLDTLSHSQHGFRNYRGERKKTRWQYRRIQHRMIERQLAKYGDRERENIYLVPVHLNLDCVHGFPMRTYPLNARMATEEQRVLDGAHLSPDGYRQFGDSIYGWIKVVLSER